MKAVFRPQFWIDLEEGVAYLAVEASPQVAARWHAGVFKTVRLIEQQPKIGRERTDLQPEGLRSFRVADFPSYLVFYRLQSESLEILRVKHGMMNLPALFPGSE